MKISNKLFNDQQLSQFSKNMEKIQKIQDKISSGKNIIFAVRDLFLADPRINRLVTMSPKTEMAKRFHTKNGATLLNDNADSYNFEYQL